MPQRERAQLGLKYIEDAIVAVLTDRPSGMTAGTVADALGLRTDLAEGHRDMIAEGILSLLARNGRILWDETKHAYVDNPEGG